MSASLRITLFVIYINKVHCTNHNKTAYSVASMPGKEVSIKIANKPIICKNTMARQLTLWQQCRAAVVCSAWSWPCSPERRCCLQWRWVCTSRFSCSPGGRCRLRLWWWWRRRWWELWPWGCLPPVFGTTTTTIIIIIMEICKAPTLWLKVLNKHSITHIMYIEMKMLSAIKN